MISTFFLAFVCLCIASAQAACVNPAGVEGEKIYNTSEKMMQFCNGTNWVAMACNNEGGALPAHCSLPWGGSILDSETVTAFQMATEPFGGSCTSETRSCSNGALSGTYANQNCSVSPPADCTPPWGGTVTHGNDVTAYQNATEPFGGSCTSETRTCNNGALSGSYTNQNCSVSPPADCSAPWGGTVNHGSNVTAYQTASVPFGNTCASQTRSCNNGTLSGSYTNQNCTVDPGTPTCPANYPASTTTCYCSPAAISSGSLWRTSYYTNDSSICRAALHNGSVSAAGGDITVIPSAGLGSYTGSTQNGVTSSSYGAWRGSFYFSGSPPPPTNQSCSLPWGGSISHGQSRTAYLYSNQSCGISQTRTCNNGSLSGSYTNQNCSVPACTTIGQTCADGTVYVGGGLYTTPSDSGNQNWYNAETTCTNLNAYSHSDWYLPNLSELNQLYSNRISIGGFNTTGSYPLGWYWSSSSSSGTQATMKKFSDGFEVLNEKTNAFPFRCVRR